MKTTNCPACKGTGQVPLKPWVRETLRVIPDGQERTTHAVTKSLRIKFSAASMRLNRMTADGLLRRTAGPGGCYLYTRA